MFRFISVKFINISRGEGYEFSLQKTVLQIASALALLKLTTAISDFFMLNFYPNKTRRRNFKKLKIEDSVDFSDKGDRIDYIRFLREERERGNEQ